METASLCRPIAYSDKNNRKVDKCKECHLIETGACVSFNIGFKKVI